MKWFLLLWAGPILLLGTWYGLSYYDINFGIFMLTREAHDLVFDVYSQILGIPAQDLPPLVARAIVVDSLIVFAIIALRKRKAIAGWWRRRQSCEVALPSDESLSSAP